MWANLLGPRHTGAVLVRACQLGSLARNAMSKIAILIQMSCHPYCEFAKFYRENLVICILFSYMDRECSGEKDCSLEVLFLQRDFNPCPRELSSYFEASYICLPGTLHQVFYIVNLQG